MACGSRATDSPPAPQAIGDALPLEAAPLLLRPCAFILVGQTSTRRGEVVMPRSIELHLDELVNATDTATYLARLMESSALEEAPL